MFAFTYLGGFSAILSSNCNDVWLKSGTQDTLHTIQQEIGPLITCLFSFNFHNKISN